MATNDCEPGETDVPFEVTRIADIYGYPDSVLDTYERTDEREARNLREGIEE